MRLFLVRHGETESNRNALALGQADVPLNETGRRQAGLIAEALAAEPVVAVYSSPLERARHTAEAVAQRQSLPVLIEPGFIEMNVGELEGLPFQVIREKYPGFIERWLSEAGPETQMPGGERLIDVAQRGWQTVQGLSAKHEGATIACVTHNFVLLTVLTRALGMNVANFRRLRHTVAAISLLEIEAGRVTLSRLNDTCHLDCE
jgi:broad specificity phosphatase PhoE